MNGIDTNPHYSREMRDQSQAVAIAHNYANGLLDEVFAMKSLAQVFGGLGRFWAVR